MAQQEIDYKELSNGYEFTPVDFQPDDKMVTAYLSAIEGDKRIYGENKLVPPMAVAALAMASMAEAISLPPGTIHVSQEFQFLGTVSINESLTSYARVNRKIERGKFHMLTIEINVTNQNNAKVITGETSFILPLA
ncbi:MAG: MaoC family dehydratase [Dehalococcoidales bacterium]|nr:MAG: MaoC family dehydratase [Dehalococcoidales bacterium]